MKRNIIRTYFLFTYVHNLEINNDSNSKQNTFPSIIVFF